MTTKRAKIVIIMAFALLIAICALSVPTHGAALADYVEPHFITVTCPHAEYELDPMHYYTGDLVEITFKNIDKGYSIDHILVSVNDEPVANKRKDNKVGFIMPDGDVDVIVTFVEERKTLSTKEIVAICVAGVLVSVAVGYFIYLKVKKKRA